MAGHGVFFAMSPEEAAELADAAVGAIEERWHEVRLVAGERGGDDQYRTVVPRDYAPVYGDDDCGTTWGWFEKVRDLRTRAAALDLAVVFTVLTGFRPAGTAPLR